MWLGDLRDREIIYKTEKTIIFVLVLVLSEIEQY